MTGHSADIEWQRDGVPVSRVFDDPYYSLEDGLAETRHVFLAGNDLPARLHDGFRIAELGFGTGLNLLTLALSWSGPGTLHFTSFEAFPMAPADMERALAHFPEAAAIAIFRIFQERLSNIGRHAEASAVAALAKAEAAYVEYQARARNLPSPVEKDFEAAIAQPVKQLEKGRKTLPRPKKKGDA